MDQNNPTNSGLDHPVPTGSGSMGAGELGNAGATSGSMGSASGTDTASSGGFGVSSATESEICPTCGQSKNRGGLEQFLGRIGINDEMIHDLKTQFQNVDLDEYLNTARNYLKDSGNKAGTYAKENPGRVAAGVAALAVGAGILFAAVNRDKRS